VYFAKNSPTLLGEAEELSAIELVGERQINGNSITLQDDGQVHKVWLVLG
jgi:hypothetical protein